MDWDASTAARLLRARTTAVVDAWDHEIQGEAPELAHLGPLATREHVGELIEGIADRIDGSVDRAAALRAAVETHARQRLQHGVPLGVVLREYRRLRVCLHSALGELAPLTQIDALLDVALEQAIEHYVTERETQRERFIGMLAHDLRTPLTCVSIACELLLDSEPTESQQVMLRRIGEASDRMQRMVGDVLDFARHQLGETIAIDRREHDFAAIVRAAVDELSVVYGERAFAVEVAGELRGLFDRDRAHQLVSNLLRNALEHGRGGTLVRAFENESGSIVLVVRNRGELAASSGRGLGLYIVGQIARAHGARVELATGADETIVTVYWPKQHLTPLGGA